MIKISLLILFAMIIIAFALRIFIGSLKFIYKSAPFIVTIMAILFVMYSIEVNRNDQQMKDLNARTIRTIED